LRDDFTDKSIRNNFNQRRSIPLCYSVTGNNFIVREEKIDTTGRGNSYY